VKQFRILFIAAILAGMISSVSSSQTKLAQTGFGFLGISSDARSSAMGDAVISLSANSEALFHNPATMADIPTFFTSSFSINNWIADIKYLSLSMLFSPFEGDYGTVGLSLQSVDYGDIQGTLNWNNGVGYIDTEILNPAALAIGVGYAIMISDKFGVGTQVRFTYQQLGESMGYVGNELITKRNVADALAFDFGTIYKTGIKSLAFGMSVRNFSKEVKFEKEGFQLPLIFIIGISANVFDFVEVSGPEQDLILSIDATHPRSHPEEIKIGAEYKFMKMLSLRGGYVNNNDEYDFSFGFGLSSAGFGVSSFNFEVDYSYTPFGVFDNVQRFTAGSHCNKGI
jgi:hypothetical protein